jgi:hypothetical protein
MVVKQRLGDVQQLSAPGAERGHALQQVSASAASASRPARAASGASAAVRPVSQSIGVP